MSGKIGYLIAKCGRCGAIWALDFEPDRCTCDEYRPHRDDDVQTIEADDYTNAVAVAYPTATTEDHPTEHPTQGEEPQ